VRGVLFLLGAVVIDRQLNTTWRLMFMYLQPLEGSLSPSLSPLPGAAEGDGTLLEGSASGALSGDAISRFVPPYSGGASGSQCQPGMYGSLAGMMEQLMQMLAQLMGYSGGGGNNGMPYGNEQYFQNANGGSNGDPHLSFNGSTWNSMTSHPDLLNSNSIPGGFQISTQVTPANANGVTYNQSATISLNGGNTTIAMNNNGQPTITSYGQTCSIADGQTMQLGNGESVTRNQNGSLTVVASNGYGGQISTTLTAQGQGVNVDVSAQNVDLGGALVRGQNGGGEQGPVQWPVPSPISGPVYGPIGEPISAPGPGPIGGPIYGGSPYPVEPMT
jgi:hypothetical protein